MRRQNMKIHIENKIFEQDEKGTWYSNYYGAMEGWKEEEVIEIVKKKDPKNLRKYFPMHGFHN
jgi:hypothetical protein